MTGLRGYDAWLANRSDEAIEDGLGDIDCPECHGLGYTLERDEDNGLGYRAECECVKRARQERE